MTRKKVRGWILLILGLSLVVLELATSKYWKLIRLLNTSYLVLLQNSNELRPTGGFIGSYAIINVAKGRIEKAEVSDIYEADGQIKGHVEPPEPIQEAFQLGEWRLRDANWEADFSESGQKLNWFFDKAGVRDYQIIVATNLSVFEELAGLLGKIELPDYNEVITRENLWEKAQHYAQYNFFPGSKQKRDFLSDLAFAVKEKLMKSNILTKFRLIKLTERMFAEKQVMLWGKNESLENIFDDLGWSGKLKKVKCPWYRQNCIRDYLTINEANLGVNKANCCIERNVKLTISRDAGSLKHNLEIKFKNNSNNQWGGKYKAWVRVYAPNSESVQGFWAEVPVGEEKTYNVEYDLLVEGLQKEPIYLLVQKQSGVKLMSMEIEYWNTDKRKKVSRIVEIVRDIELKLK